MKNQKERLPKKGWARTETMEEPRAYPASSLEESIERMQQGFSVEAHARLPSNAISEKVRQLLLDLEIRALEHTGQLGKIIERHESTVAITKLQNRSTSKIIARLKAKKTGSV